MPTIDKSYGSIPVTFPDTPHPSGGLFAAYIVSFMPDDPQHRIARRLDIEKQLRWWELMTDIPVHVIASNWQPLALKSAPELGRLAARGGSVINAPAQSVVLNRNAALQAFYASDHPWGIIMDDDAILYDSPNHNSGAAFFSEMAKNASSAYDDIDMFFPINPGKLPGQNTIWSADPVLYRDNHVFSGNHDLKGSIFIVRNFRLSDRPQILTPPHTGLGEDTLLAMEAVSKGCTVYRCENIVLKEFSGKSHFRHTRTEMKKGNEVIATKYAVQGLRMGSEHLLDRRDFLRSCLSGRPDRVVVAKP
ncbi:hypothetical protein [Agrobacterium sp. SORGH_AS 787]|uniref:hypothetical protein n=1 Tax=Agrobacterium sp. SORGH_AS 787 TaxID=3041775 RepID=UPI0027833912|nr:hypothetical protein [Rhizobium sp. SORGH_AS_0787]